MLSGETRLRLLSHLHQHPGQYVTEIAKAIGIGVSDASQELRRIQSRGILQAEYQGAKLIYRFGADPLVYSAAPILKALRSALSKGTTDEVVRIRAIALGLGHRKRIALIQALRKSPKNAYALQQAAHVAYAGIRLHLQTLLASGLIRSEGRTYKYVPPSHPLAKALVNLLPR